MTRASSETEVDLSCPHCGAPYCIDGSLNELNTVACNRCGKLMYMGDRKLTPGRCKPTDSDK